MSHFVQIPHLHAANMEEQGEQKDAALPNGRDRKLSAVEIVESKGIQSLKDNEHEK